jgi:hypothetical protein
VFCSGDVRYLLWGTNWDYISEWKSKLLHRLWLLRPFHFIVYNQRLIYCINNLSMQHSVVEFVSNYQQSDNRKPMPRNWEHDARAPIVLRCSYGSSSSFTKGFKGREERFERMGEGEGEGAVMNCCRYFVTDFLEGCMKPTVNVGNSSPGRHLVWIQSSLTAEEDILCIISYRHATDTEWSLNPRTSRPMMKIYTLEECRLLGCDAVWLL